MKLTNSVYTIEEAAALLTCEPRNLIRQGIAGEFKLLVTVPRDLDVYNGGDNEVVQHRCYSKEGAKPKPFRQSDLEFFVLPEEALQLLATSQVFKYAIFPHAAKLSRYTGEIEIFKAEPPIGWNGMILADKSPDVFARCFATYRVGTDMEVPDNIKHPQKFEIKASELLIDRPTIKLLKLKAAQDQAAGPILEVALSIQTQLDRDLAEGTKTILGFPHLDIEPYTSTDLRVLHKLFTRFWNQFGSVNFLPPKKEAIEEILIQEFDFSANKARFGATVIAGNVRTDADSRTGAPRMVPELMNALIAGSVEHWNPKPTKPSPNPSNAEVSDWFVSQYSTPKWQAKIAAMIIRGPNAPKGRRLEE